MTEEPSPQGETSFSSTLPVIVYTRPAGETDWQAFDRGPGYFHIPAGQEVGIRIKGIDDRAFKTLVQELRGVEALRSLDLAENRNITNASMEALVELKQLEILNLSSCSITSTGLAVLRPMQRLQRLNLSYCNKLLDPAVKTLEAMRNLEWVDLQGCVHITQGAIARMRRRNLVIHR